VIFCILRVMTRFQCQLTSFGEQGRKNFLGYSKRIPYHVKLCFVQEKVIKSNCFFFQSMCDVRLIFFWEWEGLVILRCSYEGNFEMLKFLNETILLWLSSVRRLFRCGRNKKVVRSFLCQLEVFEEFCKTTELGIRMTGLPSFYHLPVFDEF
jgi:hypothetical protein